MKYLLTLSILFSSLSFAHENEGGCQGNCSPNPIPNPVPQNVTSESNSAAGAIAGALSGSESNSAAGALSGSKSKAKSGDVTGTNTNEGNKSNITVEGATTVNKNKTKVVYDFPSAQAAMALGGQCTDGMSGQNVSGGFSLSRSNPVCEQLMISKAYLAMENKEEAEEALLNAEKIADIRGVFRTLLTVATLGIL